MLTWDSVKQIKMLNNRESDKMAFVVKTSISLPALNLQTIHAKFKNYYDTSIARRPKFCKTCCKPRINICPRTLARYKEQFKSWRSRGKGNNFVLIGTRYITELYQWTNKNNFLRSIIASAILFAIGIKLTGEMNAWNLS